MLCGAVASDTGWSGVGVPGPCGQHLPVLQHDNPSAVYVPPDCLQRRRGGFHSQAGHKRERT
jgi:hypothetical protein